MSNRYRFDVHYLEFSSDLSTIYVKQSSDNSTVGTYHIPNGNNDKGLELKHQGGDIILTDQVPFSGPAHSPRVTIQPETGDCARFDRSSGGGGLVIGIGDVRFSVGTNKPGVFYENNYSSSPIVFRFVNDEQIQYLDADPAELNSNPC